MRGVSRPAVTRGRCDSSAGRASAAATESRRHAPPQVLTAAWSAKGRWLATGSDDAAIKIWKVSDSGTVRWGRPHLAAAANAPRARQATEHRTLRGHTAKVKQVSWSPVKEHHLASVSSADKSLRIWDADSAPRSPATAPPRRARPLLSSHWPDWRARARDPRSRPLHQAAPLAPA